MTHVTQGANGLSLLTAQEVQVPQKHLIRLDLGFDC